MRKLMAALVAVVGTLLVAATAQGAVTVNHFSSTTQVGPISVPDVGCGLPVGVLAGTDTVAGQFVQHDNGSVEVEGTDTFAYRVDFPNGDYFISPSATTHFHFILSSPGDTVTVGSSALDRGTLYDASGDAIGTVTFHDTSYTTVAQGTVTVSFDRFFFTCK